jgi:mono/diheme cytochrome c family protein
MVILLSSITLLLIVSSCSLKDPKFQQYYAQGQVLYEKHCSNCHQKDGKGLERVYPPLASSDFYMTNFEKSFCIMKYGIQGEIIVNGKGYNKAMPAIPSLTELEIAEITTYISNSWGHERGLIDVAKASEIMSKCPR